MNKSQSVPGLGKGMSPLRGYLASHPLLSTQELEAEALYYAAISATLTKAAFAILAKDLARRSPDAGAYLTWLIYRGWQWPAVAAAKSKCDASSSSLGRVP